MNRLTFIVFAILILLIGGGAAWYLIDTRNEVLGVPEPIVSTTPEIHEGLAIYTNGSYGFSIYYPDSSDVSYEFDPSYHLGTAWRANALPEGTGSSIVSIVPYHTESEDSYPRYFNAMVRVGASTDPLELARCEKRGEDQGETELPDVVIGTHTWKAFSFQDAGMMQYASGISYRTTYEGKCIALEKVRTGSIYREESSPKDIPEDVLDAEYQALSSIVESFSFAR